jgi:predicted secreted protein
MNFVSALVLLAVIWFLTLFVVIPIRLETQGDVGERVEGTHAGSPASSFSMKRKIRITTLFALPIWVVFCAVIIWGDIGVRDIDIFGRMGPPSQQN